MTPPPFTRRRLGTLVGGGLGAAWLGACGGSTADNATPSEISAPALR